MAFDLDDEELEATRKLNGVAKDSNIEIIEDFINEIKDFELNKDVVEIVNALEDILEEREADKKRIKELEEENKNRINREIVDYKRILKINNVKATEEDWKNDKSWIIAMLNVAEEDATRYKKELEDSIPKQKIIDKIEELKEHYNTDNNIRIYTLKGSYELQVAVLQELLEDK